MYNIQGLKFVKHVDDSGIVIDELVWRTINPVIAKKSGMARRQHPIDLSGTIYSQRLHSKPQRHG